MTTSVASGWDVYNAMAVEPAPRGRLALVGAGASGWGWDVRPGYAGWGYTQVNVTAHETITRAILQWLTRKTSGMNILLWRLNTSLFFGPIGFIDFAERSSAGPVTFYTGTFDGSAGLSSTVTLTNTGYSSTTWTGTAWYGSDGSTWNPTNYDVVILPSNPNSSYHWAGVDAYLAAGGAIWGLQGSTTTWNRYGIASAGGNQSGGAPDYLNAAFAAAQLGTDLYRYGIYSTEAIAAGTNTKGGTATVYSNALGLWDLPI